MALSRIILHWTAGANKVSSLDMKHYHFIIDGEGQVVNGNRMPEANISTRDGDYVAHTRGTNTGSIGVSIAGMAGAKEHPFDAGSAPITKQQVAAMVRLVADLCETYGIPVTRETVLMHSEVERTLNIKQRGKWDLNWLPGMDKPGDAVKVGDGIRSMVKDYMDDAGMDINQPANIFSDTMEINTTPTLSYGSRGAAVERLQDELKRTGFLSGPADGDFGPMTQKAVIDAQTALGLTVDGIAGPSTWAALKAPTRTAARTPEPEPIARTQPTIAAADMHVMEDMAQEADAEGSNTLKQMEELRAIAGVLGFTGAGSLAGLASYIKTLDPIVIAVLGVVALALIFAWYRINTTANKTTDSRLRKGYKANLQQNVLARIKEQNNG